MEDKHETNFRIIVKRDRPDNSINPPDDERLNLYKELKTKYFAMVERDDHRKRFPLGFRQAFREFIFASNQADQWVWPEVKEEVEYMRSFAETLRPHYKKSKEPAKQQKEKTQKAKVTEIGRCRLVYGARNWTR